MKYFLSFLFSTIFLGAGLFFAGASLSCAPGVWLLRVLVLIYFTFFSSLVDFSQRIIGRGVDRAFLKLEFHEFI